MAMKSWQPLLLLHGRYLPPQTGRGQRLLCEIRGTVTVSGFRAGPIPWPYAKVNGRPLILCGDLVQAVKRESEFAVAHHFGVSTATVKVWRRSLPLLRHPWRKDSNCSRKPPFFDGVRVPSPALTFKAVSHSGVA
jgi:hypothetical protein